MSRSFEDEPVNDIKEKSKGWDQVAHGTYKYWRTVT